MFYGGKNYGFELHNPYLVELAKCSIFSFNESILTKFNWILNDHLVPAANWQHTEQVPMIHLFLKDYMSRKIKSISGAVKNPLINPDCFSMPWGRLWPAGFYLCCWYIVVIFYCVAILRLCTWFSSAVSFQREKYKFTVCILLHKSFYYCAKWKFR